MVASQTATIVSINPATKEVLGEVPILGQSEVQAAVERSWAAYELWNVLPFHKRSRKILEIRRVIEQKQDEIADLVCREVGKPRVESYLSELTGPLDTCIWLSENAERMLRDQMIQLPNPLLSSKQSLVAFEPLGPIGVIAPWNYPFSIPMMTILMAVMLGNTVVLKPSEKSPLIGIKIGELFDLAGFPKDVVSVITGDRSTGEHLTNCRLAKLIFTGSVEGGMKVMAQAAPHLTPVTLELGGKDAAIVLPDAPVDWTARGLVWGAYTNAGQACASIERLYLIKGKKTDALIERILHHTKALKLGNPSDMSVDVGPVIDEIQLEKVISHVDEARALGANVLTGGNRREDLGGFFYEPTIVTGVNHKMSIMQKESFGPVLPIMVVDSEDEAVELANDSEFGLTASVWGKNLARAEGIARDLNVGTVLLNDCLFSHAAPQLPWGGLKKSGFGRSHSQFGLQDLCNIKHINIDSPSASERIWWYPYGEPRVKVAKGGIGLLHGSFPMGKTKGLFTLLGNMFRKAK